MSKPFDATLKELIERFPKDWLRVLGIAASGAVSVIDADVSTVSAQSDKVIRIGGKRPRILHFEAQASWDAELAARLLLYNVLLSARHGLPVKTVVFLLRREADGKHLTGHLERDYPDEGNYLNFRYQVVRVWEQPALSFLTAGLGTLPMAPLANVTKRQVAGVIRQMEQRLEQEATPAQADDIWTATYVLMGLRYSKEFAQQMLKGVQGMEESVTYQAIIRKGREQGEINEARKILLRVGTKRLGEPDVETRAAIDAIGDTEAVEVLAERVIEVENWSELFASPTA